MKQMFSIYDKVTQEFGAPIFSPSREVLLRDLKGIMNSDNGFAFPDDLQLFYLGDWNEKSGTFHTRKTPDFELNLSDLKVGD